MYLLVQNCYLCCQPLYPGLLSLKDMDSFPVLYLPSQIQDAAPSQVAHILTFTIHIISFSCSLFYHIYLSFSISLLLLINFYYHHFASHPDFIDRLYLSRHGVRQSFSRVGKPGDNSWSESLPVTSKRPRTWLQRNTFNSLRECKWCRASCKYRDTGA